jgi:outer membrane protein assembly factor BamE (lipoprotein component of BamABCDE complex)
MPRILASIAFCALVSGCAASLVPQYRSDDLFGRVQAGMRQDEVRALMGTPANTMDFARSNTTSWGYFAFDSWGYYVEFSVTFGADGRVVSKNARRINDGGNRE